MELVARAEDELAEDGRDVPSTVRVVTKSACAISPFVRPLLASSATRSSLAVSESTPDRTTRRGRAPIARGANLLGREALQPDRWDS